MKPRLEATPLTEEDRRIWRFVCCYYWHERYQTIFCAELEAQRSDRRDAALMWSMVGVAAMMGYTTAYRHRTFAFHYAGIDWENLLP